MFYERLIVAESLRSHPDGCAFDIRLTWYRALPLSCIDVSVAIDGTDVPLDGLRLIVNGQTHPAASLVDLPDEWWFVTDPATVIVPRSLADGEHQLDVRLGTRIPYIIAGPGAVRLEERLVTVQTIAPEADAA